MRNAIVVGIIAVLGTLTLPFHAGAADEELARGFDWAGALVKAKGLARPRTFPAGAESNAIFQASLVGSRQAPFSELVARVQKNRGQSKLMDLPSIIANARTPDQVARLVVDIKALVYFEVRACQEVGFAALVNKSDVLRSDAMQRMKSLLTLDPKGETGVEKEDLSAMLVARTLALGLDWFREHWSPEERGAIIGAITVRMEDFAVKLVRGPKPLAQFPLDSHSNEVLGALAEIAVLLVGETPMADRWFSEFAPLYARLLTPFGGQDGGYANGTAYASWDVGEYSLWHWDTLRRAIGLDVTRKAWARNFGRYLTYFVPPGTPTGVFGDAAEMALASTWARYAKTYLARVPDVPLYRWYAKQWFQENPSNLEMLIAPVVQSTEGDFPPDTPNSAVFASIGWSAHHSDLRDRGRTSLYFKSSPYGAVSHSHSDQNSFVINSAGRPLLIDSGYYDYFGSRHHFQWTKRTIAHNAITFDGGQGQEDESRPWGTESAKGQVTQFSTDAEVDVVVGDATQAYRGKLSHAQRGIVYLRPDVFLIFDRVASSQARTWEWNLHSLNRMEIPGGTGVVIRNMEATACVDFNASSPTRFEQSSAFTAAPIRTSADPRPDQWHGKHVSVAPTAVFWSVAVVRIGCSPRNVEVRISSSGANAKLGTKQVSFDGMRISVQ